MIPFFLAGSSKKEISIDDAMEAFCHIWIDPDRIFHGTSKHIYYHDGTYGWYNPSSPEPFLQELLL
jgi:hypothetical protein